MPLEQTGVELVADGADAFEAALDSSAGAMSTFEDIGAATADGFNAFEEIVTGALRRVGEVAINFAMEAGSAILEFAADSFEGALEAEEGLARLSGAIRRAGEDAPVTEQTALDLAEAYKELAGGSDDAVLAAQAVLLKFQSIDKDAFEPALATALDLAAIMGTDAASAAEQLGRALEDPERATRLLKAAGVVLTDQEKKQIKAWADSGDAASAQAFILDKLQKASAGAAEDLAKTTGGQLEIFKETIADAGEQIATAFLPILQMLMDKYLLPLLPVIGQVADVIALQVMPAFDNFSGSLAEAQTQLQPVIDALNEMFAVFQEDAPAMMAIGEELFAFLSSEFGITLPVLIDSAVSSIQSLTRIWDEHGETIMGTIAFAFKIIAATILGTLTLIGGAVDVTLRTISGAFDFWSAVLEGRWADAWDVMLATVADVTSAIFDTLLTFVEISTSVVTDGMRDAFADWLMTATSGIQDALIQAGRAGLEAYGRFYDVGIHLMDGLRRGISAGIGWITDAIASTVQSAINNAMSILGIRSPSKLTMELIGEPIGLGVADGILQAVGAVKTSMDMLIQPAMSPSQYIGASSNVSNSNSNNWNLNVSSNQSSQGIQSDFGIMAAMAG